MPLTVAGLHTESRSLAEIWSALGGELKPSLDLVVTAPFPAYPEYDAGPPVTEGAAVRVRGMDGTLEGSPERHHQTRHLARTPAVAGPASSAASSSGTPSSGTASRPVPSGSGPAEDHGATGRPDGEKRPE